MAGASNPDNRRNLYGKFRQMEYPRPKPDNESEVDRSDRVNIFDVLLFVPDIINLIIRLISDNNVSTRNKSILIFGILYLFFPIDFVLDPIIPPIGFIDDIIVLILILGAVFND